MILLPRAAPAPHGPARPRHRLGSVAVVLALLVVLVLAVPAPGAQAQAPRSVTVIDPAGAVPAADEAQLQRDLEALRFGSDVDLVALSLEVTDYGVMPFYDDALDDAVLAHARTHHPEWIDGLVWADGLVIIAIDQHNRFVGSYAGEDVKLSARSYRSVQDAMRDDARAGDTAGALLDGADRFADLNSRPWWVSPISILVLALAGMLAVLLVLLKFVVGQMARGTSMDAHRRAELVLAQDDDVHAAIDAIPSGTLYTDTLSRLADEWAEARERTQHLARRVPTSASLLWGILPGQRRQARGFDAATTTAREHAALLIGGSDLLRREGTWQAQWAVETAPLEDVASRLESLLVEDGWGIFIDHEAPETRRAREALRDRAAMIEERLPVITRSLEDGDVPVDRAMAALDQLLAPLSHDVLEYVRTRIRANALSTRETRALERSCEEARARTDSKGGRRSIRQHARPPLAPLSARSGPTLEGQETDDLEATASDPVGYLTAWRTMGPRALYQERLPDSDSSTSSSGGGGGGGGGGSFSGSGGSGRF